MTQEDQTVDGVGRVASFHRFRCLQVKQAVAIDNARRRRGCPGSFYAVKHSVLPFVLGLPASSTFSASSSSPFRNQADAAAASGRDARKSRWSVLGEAVTGMHEP